MGLCALFLLTLPATAQSRPQSTAQLSAKLQHHLKTMEKDRQVLRFLDRHRWLLKDPRFESAAKRQLRLHTTSLARTKKLAVVTQLTIERRAKARRIAALHAASPVTAIRTVFGPYWREALAISRCESGLSTSAQNGQYLGLFQMGSSERRLYGHGPTAYEQAQAAHRYFVASGHGWGPWSCKPW
jgi:hypothetical protein